MFSFYFTRLYIHVRPERVYVWPHGDPTVEPELFDAHMEEVRSGHDEEPEARPPAYRAAAPCGTRAWTSSARSTPRRCCHWSRRTASRSASGCRSRSTGGASRPDRRGALGVPVQRGLACLAAHAHGPRFEWQENFQVRGDLVEEDGGWALVPHRLIGGLELPPVSKPKLYAMNARR